MIACLFLSTGVVRSQADGMVMGHRNLYYGTLSGMYDCGFACWPYQQDMQEQGLGLDKVEMKHFVITHQNDKILMWPDAWTIDDAGWVYNIANKGNEFLDGELDFSGTDSNFRIISVFMDDMSYVA